MKIPAFRVAHLIKGLGRGGAERLIPQTLRAGSDAFEYSVGDFLPWKDALAGEVEAAGARVHCFGTRTHAGLLASVPKVAAWLRDEGVDLVHAHLPLAGVVARMAGRLAGVPVIYTEHNLQERYHPLTRRANALTWRWQSRVVAVSGEVAGSIERHLERHGPRVPVRVVLNGIEVDRPAPDPARVSSLRRALDLPSEAPVVGTVAVLRRQKRLDLWLEAARRLLAGRSDIRFVIVGDGPLRRELEAETERLGLSSTVRFAGLQEDVAPYLALFDLFLISSEFEGLPLALLEAMAAGVPVVATAVGGIPEAIAADREGLLVPFGHPGALADAVGPLLDDPSRRSRLVRAARERVARDFSVERMARELEALYAEVVRGGA